MSQPVLLVCFFEGDPDEVVKFADRDAAEYFANGVFCGANAYGCGSVDIYIRTEDGLIINEGEEDAEIGPPRLANLQRLFSAADGAAK